MAAKKKGAAAGSAKEAAPGSVKETAAGYAFESVMPGDEPARKKNLRLHQTKIDAARAILGTSTETETIETALDLVVFRKELVDGVRALRDLDIADVFGSDA